MTSEPRRDIPPEIPATGSFRFVPPEKTVTPCGVPVYVIPGEKHEMVRIDMLFGCGAYNQEKALQASSASVIASEATRRYSSARMSEIVDYYGGWLQRSVYMHATQYTLYVPRRNYGRLLPVFMEIFCAPRFSRRDFSLYKGRGKEEYRQMYERVDFLAARSLRKQLYGEHPYGNTATAGDFDNLTVALLREYHEKYCRRNNCTAVVSGCIDDKVFWQTAEALAALPEPDNGEPGETALFPSETGARFTHDEKDDAMQCSVRIGSRIEKDNMDEYILLGIVNTVLGGYFGSRLMTNIREEKGYTYGIGSGITALRYAASLNIAAQCDLKYASLLIKEVVAEVERLKETPVKDGELKSVRQYILGDMNRIFDNRFTLADACIALLINGQPFDYLNRKAAAVCSITPGQIMETARKYLCPGRMHIAVAGGSRQYGAKLRADVGPQG